MPPGVCYGRRDVPLASGWEAALPALASRIASTRPAFVVSSPATRCLEPARRLAQLLRLPPPLIDPDLRELDFGDWEGMAWDLVPRGLLDRWAVNPSGFAPPNGESGAALVSRVRRAAGRLRGSSALVVSHGGPLRLLPALLRGLRPDLLAPSPAPGAVEVVEIP